MSFFHPEFYLADKLLFIFQVLTLIAVVIAFVQLRLSRKSHLESKKQSKLNYEYQVKSNALRDSEKINKILEEYFIIPEFEDLYKIENLPVIFEQVFDKFDIKELNSIPDEFCENYYACFNIEEENSISKRNYDRLSYGFGLLNTIAGNFIFDISDKEVGYKTIGDRFLSNCCVHAITIAEMRIDNPHALQNLVSLFNTFRVMQYEQIGKDIVDGFMEDYAKSYANSSSPDPQTSETQAG